MGFGGIPSTLRCRDQVHDNRVIAAHVRVAAFMILMLTSLSMPVAPRGIVGARAQF